MGCKILIWKSISVKKGNRSKTKKRKKSNYNAGLTTKYSSLEQVSHVNEFHVRPK